MNSKLRNILFSLKYGESFTGTANMKPVLEAEKAIRQAVGEDVLELLDSSAKEAHSGSQHIEILRQKIKEYGGLK